jgi:hypothetical protein
MPEAGPLTSQNHFDLELSFSGQLLFPHYSLNFLLRGDAHLLEVFPHRHIELFHAEPPYSGLFRQLLKELAFFCTSPEVRLVKPR